LGREVLQASMPVTVLQDGADGLDGQGLDAGEDLGLGGLEDAVEAAEQDERQDDSAVLGLLVVAAQQIGDGPDEAGVVVGRRGSFKWLPYSAVARSLQEVGEAAMGGGDICDCVGTQSRSK
jgi:hypothetical protein